MSNMIQKLSVTVIDEVNRKQSLYLHVINFSKIDFTEMRQASLQNFKTEFLLTLGDFVNIEKIEKKNSHP